MTQPLQKGHLIQNILSSVSQQHNYDLSILHAYCTYDKATEVFTLSTLDRRVCKEYL